MLDNIYNQKVTILNKLKCGDNGNNVDIWQKTVIEDVAWYSRAERTVHNNSVSICSYIICLIPHHSEYLDYTAWRKLDDAERKNHFTMSSGDYIVLGDVDEEITAKNVISVMSKYDPDVCSVKHCERLHDRFNSVVQLRVEGT